MKTTLQYLSQVLGVETPILPTPWLGVGADPEAETLTAPAFFHTADGPYEDVFGRESLVIVNWVRDANESLFDGDVAELFEKMFAAMKIPAEQVLVLDCVMNERSLIANELYKRTSPKWVLFFTSEPHQAGEFQIKGPARWLETFSPALLVKHPGSKKIVWNDMQKLMKDMRA